MEPNAASLYERLQTDRACYLTEAYESALLTLPSLMPEDVDALNRDRTGRVLPKPNQSLGARGTNNLASKLLMALLPPTGAMLRYEIDAATFAQIPTEQVAAIKTDLEQRLASRERAIMSEINSSNIRPKSFLGMKHLIVCGNVLMYMPPPGGVRIFPLNQYVCRRDYMGDIVDLIYVEILDRETVSSKVRSMLDEESPPDTDDAGGPTKRDNKTVRLYTHVKREGKRFRFQQEVNNKVVPGTEGTVALKNSPWLVLRWTAIDGEDYGRGFVEEYRGDLRSLDTLAKALVIAGVNAAKLVPLISPSSNITPRRLAECENGEALVANADDVVFLQQQKQGDMLVSRQQKADLEQALAADFMMNSSFTRDAERVTREEIRLMAQELEDSLGGVYSVQTQDFQIPLVNRIEAQLINRGTIEKLPADTVKVSIVTGLAAIGRGQELQNLQEGVGMIVQMAPVFPNLTKRIDEGDLAKRIFIGVGVETSGLLKSDKRFAEEMEAEQKQAQQAQLLELASSGTGAAAVNQIGAASQADAQPAPE